MKTTPVKLDIGDTAFFLQNNQIVNGEITEIRIFRDKKTGKIVRKYVVSDNPYTFGENFIFPSTNALIASL